jgi:hypothetical protein
MRTFRKILVGIGLAGALSLSVIWGSRAPAIQHVVSAVTENIQKPGHMVFAITPQDIQKPGH